MSEVIINRRRMMKQDKGELVTVTYEAGNHTFIVPSSIKRNQIEVMIIAGGECYSGGGDGGGMNNGIIKVNPGESINIMVGKGGWLYKSMFTSYAKDAEASFFGNYLSANTHEGAAGWSPKGSYNYKFGGAMGTNSILCGGGGGNCYINGYGGHGGTYGGGGGGSARADIDYSKPSGDYGTWSLIANHYCAGSGGNGGIYGGGGGGSYSYFTIEGSKYPVSGSRGVKGQYGGNGAGIGGQVSNGTNTIGWSNVPKDLQGPGLGGENFTGYIGMGNTSYGGIITPSGGGGFGGCGGNGIQATIDMNGYRFWCIKNKYQNAYNKSQNIINWGYRNGMYFVRSGGGGGGYGSNGHQNGGGGGYFSDAISGAGGGYYGYCCGGDFYNTQNKNINHLRDANAGCGGWVVLNRENGQVQDNGNGCDGICVIQYYI